MTIAIGEIARIAGVLVAFAGLLWTVTTYYSRKIGRVYERLDKQKDACKEENDKIKEECLRQIGRAEQRLDDRIEKTIELTFKTFMKKDVCDEVQLRVNERQEMNLKKFDDVSTRLDKIEDMLKTLLSRSGAV